MGGIDWLSIFTIIVFSLVGFVVAAFVIATILTSTSQRNRRRFEQLHHRSKSRRA